MARSPEKPHRNPARAFIVGAPRSGTTLLQSLIASHPHVLSFPESHLFTGLRPRRSLEALGLASRRAWPRFERFAEVLGRPDLGRVRRRLTMRGIASAFVGVLDALATQGGYDAWVEKTPDHFSAIDLITRYIDGAHFIHVIRNGPDVVASLYSVTRQYPDAWGGPWSLRQCVDKWNDAVSVSLQYTSSDSHFVVHYEHVVRASKQVTRAAWDFVGLKPEEMTEKNRRSALDAIALGSEPWKADVLSRVGTRPSRVDKALTSEQRREVDAHLLRLPNLQLPCCRFPGEAAE